MATAHLFLSPGRTFWGIPDTEIRLSRQSPHLSLTDEEQDKLSDQQLKMINDSLAAGSVIRIKDEFLEEIKKKTPIQFIITKTVQEIQKQYVSSFVANRDIESLNKLKDAELESSNPRDAVIQMVEYAKERIIKKEKDFIALGLTEHLKNLPDDEADDFIEEGDLYDLMVGKV